MKIIRPSVIDDDVLVASNVAENDYSEWSGATTYNTGDRVIKTSTHLVYESLTDSNTNNDPETDASDPPKWLTIGATNRWSMFRDPATRLTSEADEIVVTLDPGVVNAIALFNLDATHVDVEMDDPIEGVVYSRSERLVDSSSITDWYAYFFEPIARKKYMALFDLPVYGDAQVTVSISNSGANAACGMCVVGMQRTIGRTAYGSQFSVIDFSRKDRDAFGQPTLVERNFSKRAALNVMVEARQINAIYDLLAAYRSTPIVWSAASGRYESPGLIYGFYRDFSVIINQPTWVPCLLEIEGMI